MVRPPTAAELTARLAADRLGTPYLRYHDGDDQERLFGLAGLDRVVIGRAAGSDLPLPWDGRVSRTHARLERVGERWVVMDDQFSRNGTFVNGTRVGRETGLADGDVVVIGQTPITVVLPAAADDATATGTGLTSVADLTEGQRRVLVALCRPLLTSGRDVAATNAEIADELVLGVATVKTHLKAMFERFGLEHLPPSVKRQQLAAGAVRMGLVNQRDVR